MKIQIEDRTPVTISLIAEGLEELEILTTLWDRMVLGTALHEPGTRRVKVLTVELPVRDLRSDMQEVRR